MPRNYQVPCLKTDLPGPLSRELIETDELVTSPSYTRAYPLASSTGHLRVRDWPGGMRLSRSVAGLMMAPAGASSAKNGSPG